MQNFPLNFITFPLWWYSVGIAAMWQWSKKHLHYSLQQTGLVMFAHHLNEPLYKDYTKSGMFIGFFLRIFVLFYKSIVFAIKTVFIFIIFLAYLALLPATLVMIIFQLLPAK